MRTSLRRFWFLITVVLPLVLRTRRRPVLFVRQGALGDIICTFPAVLELKKRHPGAAFLYSCHPDFACLPIMGGITRHVTGIHFAEESRWSFLFARIYHFQYSDEKADGFCRATLIEEFCTQHDVPPTDAHPRLAPSERALSRAKLLLAQLPLAEGPLIFFHLGPSWPVREWPQEAWASLAEVLAARGFKNLLQLGVDQHVELGSTAARTLLHTISLVNQLTVEETVALISLGHLLVGIDSGLLHIAASTRTPAIGIFGATSPQFRFSAESTCAFVVSRVECQGCHHRIPRLHWKTGCPYDIACMRTVSVEEVSRACLAKLPPVLNGQLPRHER